MPSTTNSLEASHGHLNEKLPRRNDFWTGMKRLIEFLIVNENGFKKALKCNFTRALRVLEKNYKAKHGINGTTKIFLQYKFNALQLRRDIINK